MTREQRRAPSHHVHRDLTALAPHERLTELPVLLREKPHTSATARENLRDAPVIGSQLSLGEIPAPAQPFVSSEERKERWEQGQADYMGADSFDNIKRKLDTYLQ